MNDTPTHPPTLLDTALAILIAITAAVGALIAWRASLMLTPGVDRAAISATLNVEIARFLNDATLYRHYRAYTSFALEQELATQLDQSRRTAPAAAQADLERQQVEALTLAAAHRAFFPGRYLERNGSYGLERELGEAWAQAQQNLDMRPERHITQGNAIRVKGGRLRAIMILTAVALLFFNIARAIYPTHRLLRYAATLLGLLMLMGSALAVLVVELWL